MDEIEFYGNKIERVADGSMKVTTPVVVGSGRAAVERPEFRW